MEAIVLAGGLGTRLRSVLGEVPKCLAPVAGKPFLEYLLGALSRAGVSCVVFSVGHLREQVMAYVDSRSWPFQVAYAVETTPLGTGGGIRLALSKCLEDKVLVVNGDTLFDVDIPALPFEAPVTLALKPLRNFSRYGTVELGADGKVSAFREKAPCREGLINGGVYALRRSLLPLAHLPEKFSFETDVLQPLSCSGQVAGVVQDGYFIDIGIPEDYARAQQELPEWEALAKASEKVLASGARYLFLDRDGVINRLRPHDYVKTWEEFVFLPGALTALRKWAGAFARIVLVTNQRGVGKGLMTEADLEEIHRRMAAEIFRAGGRLDAIYVCTALSDQDPRRKPQPGLFRDACRDFPEITPGESVMLGDTPSDMAFAAACGMQGIQV